MEWLSHFFDPAGIPSKPNKGYIEQTDLNGKPKTKYILPKVIQDNTKQKISTKQYLPTKHNEVVITKIQPTKSKVEFAPEQKTSITLKQRAEGLRKAFYPEEFIKQPVKTAYDKTKDPEQVKAMQMALKQKGFNIAIDGKWGPQTQKAYNESLRMAETSIQPIQPKPLTLGIGVTKGNMQLHTAKNAPSAEQISANIFQNYSKDKREQKDWLKKGGSITKHADGSKVTKDIGKTPKITATADSTKYYSDKVTKGIKTFIDSKYQSDKDLASKSITQAKGDLQRQDKKGKEGYDKNGFPVKKQKGGEMPKQGDTATVYKKGSKVTASKWKK